MNYLIDPPAPGIDPCGTLIFAHGAGALMDSDYMQVLTAEFNAVGVAVVRFEFPYMQQRREIGKKRPPDRQPILLNCWRQVYEEISGRTDLIKTPTFIFQGTRDPLGKPDELSDISFSEALHIHWLKDGDHDLKPRKSSGLTQLEHLTMVATMVADFALSLRDKAKRD